MGKAVARALAGSGVLALLVACGAGPDPDGTDVDADAARAVPSAVSESPTLEPTPEPPAEPTAKPAPEPAATEPSQDELAGLRGREVVERGNGGTAVVPGSEPAPGQGDERRVRVEVEGGLDVDGPAFAAFVMGTLNDPRSWTQEGRTFSRTDGDADIVVVLASPATSAEMCAPLVTYGKLSCRQGPRAILTMYRWVNGIEEYGDDLTGYRRYLVNHEVGHVLGKGHVACPASGAPAPVMQQQTKGVAPCVPSAWPFP